MEEFNLAQRSQKSRSMVAWPRVLEQDIMVVGVGDRRVFHVMANQEAENERRGQEIHPQESSPVTYSI